MKITETQYYKIKKVIPNTDYEVGFILSSSNDELPILNIFGSWTKLNPFLINNMIINGTLEKVDGYEEQ